MTEEEKNTVHFEGSPYLDDFPVVVYPAAPVDPMDIKGLPCPPVVQRPLRFVPMVTCEYCQLSVRRTGLRIHHKSKSCSAAQSRLSIPENWDKLSYDTHHALYVLTNRWTLNNGDSPHVHEFVTGYRRPGWGRGGRNRTDTYISHKMHVILWSKHVDNVEKLVCLYRPADSPEFNATYMLAELTRDPNETHF